MYKYVLTAILILVLATGGQIVTAAPTATAVDHGVVAPDLTGGNHGIVTILPTIIGTQDGGAGQTITLYNNSGTAAHVGLSWQGAYLINSDAPPSELYWAEAGSISQPLNAPHELATRAYPSFFEQATVVGNAALPAGATRTYVLVGRGKQLGCSFQVGTSGQLANGGSPLIIWHSDRLLTIVATTPPSKD